MPAAARATARYLPGQPNAARYVPDSASIEEVEAPWQVQVLVPRPDWAGRRPNKAVFEGDKATGAGRPLPVQQTCLNHKGPPAVGGPLGSGAG